MSEKPQQAESATRKPKVRTAPQGLRPSLRLDFGGEHRLGPGKIALLEKIIETGSISAAGRGMGMSYRRAWLLIDAVNQMFQDPVVIKTAGGVSGGGAEVTAFGRALVAAYRAVEKRVAREANIAFAAFYERLTKDQD